MTRTRKKLVVRILSAVHSLLTQHCAETMDQLDQPREWCYQGGSGWAKDVGPAKVTLIEDRIMDWLEEHRNMEATAEDGQEEETPEEDG